jgi:hypothetical protein
LRLDVGHLEVRFGSVEMLAGLGLRLVPMAIRKKRGQRKYKRAPTESQRLQSVKDPKKTPASFAPSLDRRKRDPAVISPLHPATAAMGLRTRGWR